MEKEGYLLKAKIADGGKKLRYDMWMLQSLSAAEFKVDDDYAYSPRDQVTTNNDGLVACKDHVSMLASILYVLYTH